jgi:hypothetical protein
VAASLFGAGGNPVFGPALAVYAPASTPAQYDYLSRASVIATPLAWSPDSRFLAIAVQATSSRSPQARSGLVVLDTESNSVARIAYGQVLGASFAPGDSDRMVYALAPSRLLSAPVNLYVSGPEGLGLRALTSDGRSLNPVWGPRYIAYDRERLRSGGAPAYQLWLASPTRAAIRRVASVPVGPLVSGLAPLAFSADGSRLLAEFEGQDTSAAYAVNVASGRASGVTVGGRSVQGAGISSDGSTLLIEENALEEPPSHGRVATIPFAGGPAQVLVAHGAQASWNG